MRNCELGSVQMVEDENTLRTKTTRRERRLDKCGVSKDLDFGIGRLRPKRLVHHVRPRLSNARLYSSRSSLLYWSSRLVHILSRRYVSDCF